MAAKTAKTNTLRDSNTEILNAVTTGGDRWAKGAMQSQATARKALVKLGIATPSGKLTKRYK